MLHLREADPLWAVIDFEEDENLLDTGASKTQVHFCDRKIEPQGQGGLTWVEKTGSLVEGRKDVDESE
jgi:hypothetical protein